MDDPRMSDKGPAAQGDRTARPLGAQVDQALSLARTARGRAKANYSGFAVGAAILTDRGDAFPGCNVENATYGLTMCAERVAIGGWAANTNLIDRGVILLVAIVTGADEPTAPCGACRQWLVEFAPEAWVVAESENGQRRMWTVRELLPDAFDADSLTGIP